MNERDEFLSRIDLSRPELTEAKKLCAEGDRDGAVHAVLSYLRKREKPVYLFAAKDAGACTDPLVMEEADNTLRHFIYGHQFPGPIDWHFNPTEDTSHDNEWSWSLFRTIYWQPLIRAYAKTHEEKYVREFVTQMRSFADAWPADSYIADTTFETKTPFPGHAWRTIETGMRIYTNWLAAFWVFRSSESFDDASLTVFLNLIHDHAEFLMAHYSNHDRSSNWLSMEVTALFQIGIFFPEFQRAAVWKETGYERVTHELLYCFDNQGVHMERTPIYHMVASISFLQAWRMASLNGIVMPPYALPLLVRSAEYVMSLVKPDLSTPMIGDADRDDLTTSRADTSQYEGMNLSFDPYDLNELRAYFRVLHELTGREDFRYFASEGKEGACPAKLDYVYNAGIFVQRSGWGKDDTYALVHGVWLERGERSTHSHYDQGHIELMIGGEDVLIDCGRYIYNSSCWKDWRAYFIGTQAHNTLLVDDHLMGTVPLVNRVRGVRTFIHHIEQKEGYGIIDISHNGYAFMSSPVFHRRRVVTLFSGAAIIEDLITGSWSEEHLLRLYFNFAKGKIERLGADWHYTTQKGTNFRFATHSFPSWESTTYYGSEDPKGGWASFGYPKREPIPQLVFATKASSDQRVVSIIAPVGMEVLVQDNTIVIGNERVSLGESIKVETV